MIIYLYLVPLAPYSTMMISNNEDLILNREDMHSITSNKPSIDLSSFVFDTSRDTETKVFEHLTIYYKDLSNNASDNQYALKKAIAAYFSVPKYQKESLIVKINVVWWPEVPRIKAIKVDYMPAEDKEKVCACLEVISSESGRILETFKANGIHKHVNINTFVDSIKATLNKCATSKPSEPLATWNPCDFISKFLVFLKDKGSYTSQVNVDGASSGEIVFRSLSKSFFKEGIYVNTNQSECLAQLETLKTPKVEEPLSNTKDIKLAHERINQTNNEINEIQPL